MSEHECEKCTKKPETPPKYKINRDGFGGIEVEAPNKDECVQLFREVTKQPVKGKIDEALV